MSHYTDLVDIRCPQSNHLLCQARRGMTAHVIIKCRMCKNHILIEDVDKVQRIDPPPGSYHTEFKNVQSVAGS